MEMFESFDNSKTNVKSKLLKLQNEFTNVLKDMLNVFFTPILGNFSK